MPTYRLYSIDGKGRIVRQAQYLECSNDKIAIEEAEQRLNRYVVELWQLTRRVVRLDPCEKNELDRIAS
jgi:hypothetical protein